jgi:hypothetical protein
LSSFIKGDYYYSVTLQPSAASLKPLFFIDIVDGRLPFRVAQVHLANELCDADLAAG